MNNNQVEIRRSRISNFLDDHPGIGINQHTLISDQLGLDVITVKNDCAFLKNKLREENKKYNLQGIFNKNKKRVERLEKLKEEAAKMVEENSGLEKRESMKLEMEIMNHLYHIEADGLTPMQDELERREVE